MSTQEYMCQAVFLKVSSKKEEGHLVIPLKILNPGGRCRQASRKPPTPCATR